MASITLLNVIATPSGASPPRRFLAASAPLRFSHLAQISGLQAKTYKNREAAIKMAIPNMMIFGLLCLEVATFLLLVAPMPFTWRRSLFKFLSTSPIIAKLQFGLKVTFVFVAVLFTDAVQRMIKIHQEGADAKQQGAGIGRDLRSETDWRSRKFLSERDFYLRGFTLFLSLILSRVFSLVIDLIKAQEDLAAARKSSNASARETGLADQEKEQRYKQQIKDLQREVDQLGAQVSGPGAAKKD